MNIRNLIAKRDSFTIPGLQTETGADYGTVKKCVDELFAEGVLSEPVGLTYFKLKQPRKDKRRGAPRPFALFEDALEPAEEEEEEYAYADVDAEAFISCVSSALSPFYGVEEEGSLKIYFDGVLPDDRVLTVSLEFIDGKYCFSDGGATFAAATAAGTVLGFRFFTNRLGDGGEFGRVRVQQPVKHLIVPITNINFCTLYIVQLVSAVRAFFGEKP